MQTFWGILIPFLGTALGAATLILTRVGEKRIAILADRV